jgi:hypothetical protein
MDTTDRTCEEHLEWCKTRALELVEQGDWRGALDSMARDLRKHPDTAEHEGLAFGRVLLLEGHLATAEDMRQFIEGFLILSLDQ